ncbi:MAG: DUF3343 domain-containing protein [Clostridia bacterium]|jgi:hypothetical protein|nr:DUF3343 domain-containing protein [Clostridia bacterium]MDD4275969.1 DUF3343 domain-containing protein [Clostridia bacterium]
MVYLLAVFRARTETLAYSQILKSYGVQCNIINTPRQVSVSCGISVKMPLNYFDIALAVRQRRSFSSFAGFFKISENPNNNITVTPL